MRLIIITGLSGSGKSTAARALEDEGFFVVDNLPLLMLPEFLKISEKEGREHSKVAIVVDVRNRNFLSGYDAILDSVRSAGYQVEIYFFDASDDYLIRRYSETRRRHPLSGNENIPGALSREREILEGLRRRATAVFDSSGLNVHQLRRQVAEYAQGNSGTVPMAINLQSFGFRYGLPAESDLVLDVRFLPNPHFVDELRPLTGLDRSVSAHVLESPEGAEFLKKWKDLLRFLLPLYRSEGKSYLTVSIGCTGGRHRSVAIVEELRSCLSGEGITLEVTHRDIAKE